MGAKVLFNVLFCDWKRQNLRVSDWRRPREVYLADPAIMV